MPKMCQNLTILRQDIQPILSINTYFQEGIYSTNVFNGLWLLIRQHYDKILTKSFTTNIPQIQYLNL